MTFLNSSTRNRRGGVPTQKPRATPAPPSGPGRCIVATAAYGSEMAPDVVYMRFVRDNLIGSSPVGRKLVAAFNAFYYSWSPTVAKVVARSELLRAISRVVLLPLVGIAHVTALVFMAATNATGSTDLASVAAFVVAAAVAVAIYAALPLLAGVKLAQGIRRERRQPRDVLE